MLVVRTDLKHTATLAVRIYLTCSGKHCGLASPVHAEQCGRRSGQSSDLGLTTGLRSQQFWMLWSVVKQRGHSMRALLLCYQRHRMSGMRPG